MERDSVRPSPADNKLNVLQATLDRFMKNFQPNVANGCWDWVGSGGAGGYGAFGAKEVGGAIAAHRLSYQLTFGLLDDGLVIHHRCANKRCVNPEHLEAVAIQEHKGLEIVTHCRNGHEYTEMNTRYEPSGHRRCRWCEREAAQRTRDRQRGVSLVPEDEAKVGDPLSNKIGLPVPMLRRFLDKIRKDDESDCWFWTASVSPHGYGQFQRPDLGRPYGAHRMSYELAFGLIPEGRQVHHKCVNPQCVNPAHLEVVTPLEHSEREPLSKGNRAHCIYGHEYTPENTAIHRGYPRCKQCQRDKGARDYAKYREAVPLVEQTHCVKGHPLSGENLYMYKGSRSCKQCRDARARQHFVDNREKIYERKNDRRRMGASQQRAERDAQMLELFKTATPEEILEKVKATYRGTVK